MDFYMSSIKQSFGERLKELRTAHGYSQYSLAKKIEIPRRTICYYECEAKNPRPPAELLSKLSDALKVPVNVLLGTEEAKFDGRTIDSKFWPKWDLLTSDDKKVIAKIADTLIEKNDLLSKS